jgi:hypothetical protein
VQNHIAYIWLDELLDFTVSKGLIVSLLIVYCMHITYVFIITPTQPIVGTKLPTL